MHRKQIIANKINRIASPVSGIVNMVRENDPSMLNPIGEKLLKEIIPTPLEQRRHQKEKPFPEIPWIQSRQQSGEHKD